MKNTAKRITAILLTFVLIFSLAGCGEVKKAETAVNGMFAAFMAGDFDEAQKYVDISDFENDSNPITGDTKTMMEVLFGSLSYNIVSSEKNDDGSVSVKTEITATDMKPVLADLMLKAIEYSLSNAFADPAPTEEEMNAKMQELFIESATKPDLATVTNTVDIKAAKTENGDWKIQGSDELVNALLGGMTDAALELSDALNNAAE